MIKKLAVLSVLCSVCLFGGRASAQYYDWGQDPASVKWRSIKTAHNRFVFPDYYQSNAVRLMHYFDTIRPYISYGFTKGPLRLPVVIHTQNFQNNGIVILAPKRMEFIVTPSAGGQAMPWLKQLAVHESRHAVHYNNVNYGWIRPLSWVFGQQGALVGIIFYPQWMIEGDAVMAETQMSSFGRGRQPSFSIDYRMMSAERNHRYPMDKYFSGSFKDYMPDHYQLGYQIVTYAYTKYDENIWDKTGRYGARHPYLIATNKIALKKYYGTSVDKLFRETFDDLDQYWASLPAEENSARLTDVPVTAYTTYLSPVAIDSGTAVAIKSDLDRSYRLVKVDTETGKEKVLTYIGIPNTGLTHANGMLYWTEYRRSTFWDQRVNSVLCSYDLQTGRKSDYKDRRAMFAQAMPAGEPAIVDYNYTGSYTVKYDGWEYTFPDNISIHGFAWDDKTRKFYFIGLDDGGMFIASMEMESNGFTNVSRHTYSSMSNLRAAGGKLYYNSIASGKDEAYMFDLESGIQKRITTSKYGSFAPAPIPDRDSYLATTFTKQGYILSVQDNDNMVPTEFDPMPVDIVNPPRVKWDVMNIDSVTVEPVTELPAKKFRKGLHLFQFHSWGPVSFDADKLVSEANFSINAGVTVLSQNLLNSTFSQFGYEYSGGNHHLKGKVSYYGWAPKFEVDVHWSNHDQLVSRPRGDSVPLPGKLNKFFEVTGRVYLPILFSSGSHYRRLTPMVEISHDNTLLYNANTGKYMRGLEKTVYSLQYNEYVRLAYRDFLPRWGYAARVSYTMNPFNKNFGQIVSGYGRVYIPGISKHHSLMLRGAAQYQKRDMYVYRQKELLPRGADFDFTPHKYASASADYQFPIWYPDGGIKSLLYFKRVRLNFAGDFARYKDFAGKTHNLHSYGGDIVLDIAPMRLPSSTNATVTIGVYNPSDRKGPYVNFGFTLPI